MNRRIRTVSAVSLLVLSAPLLVAKAATAAPALAPRGGAWPGGLQWTGAPGGAFPRAQTISSQAPDPRLSVPRGDLRKDVTDASRTPRQKPTH